MTGSRLTTLLGRILFIAALTIGVMIGMLKLLERSGDPLRQGIESYLAQTTRSHVYVGALPKPQFFPNVHMTIQNTIFSDRHDPQKKLASVESLEFSVPFINLLIGRQAFENLQVTNFHLEKDALWPRPLHVDNGVLVPGPSPVFQLTGEYGAAPLVFTLDVIPHNGTPSQYSLPSHTGFTLILGQIKIAGILDSRSDGLELQDVVMTPANPSSGQVGYGPQSFFIQKNQEFIKDNPLTCLMEQSRDLKLTASHPCATLFQKNTAAEGQE